MFIQDFFYTFWYANMFVSSCVNRVYLEGLLWRLIEMILTESKYACTELRAQKRWTFMMLTGLGWGLLAKSGHLLLRDLRVPKCFMFHCECATYFSHDDVYGWLWLAQRKAFYLIIHLFLSAHIIGSISFWWMHLDFLGKELPQQQKWNKIKLVFWIVIYPNPVFFHFISLPRTYRS